MIPPSEFVPEDRGDPVSAADLGSDFFLCVVQEKSVSPEPLSKPKVSAHKGTE